VLEWWQWALAVIAALLVGISKTAIAGLGVLSVALFASVMPPRDAVGTVLVTLIAGDLIAIATYRREASWGHLVKLFPWAAGGVILGALAVGRFDDGGLRRAIGVILVGLVAFSFIRQRTGLGGEGEEISKRPWLVALVGLTAGITTMIANAAGPIMVLYLLGQKLPKRLFIGTAAWYFFALNLFKVPFSVGLGMINPSTLGVALWLVPCAWIGGLIGRKLIDKLDQKLFEQLALALTFVAGLRLLL
jgi:uncharacterized protein